MNFWFGKLMQISFVTTYDVSNVDNWSGTGYYMAKALESQKFSVNYINSLRENNLLVSKAKKLIYKLGLGKTYLRDRDLIIAKNHAKQVSRFLQKDDCDVVFSTSSIPIAYLDCEQPIVFWTDATFAGMVEFYQEFSNLCAETMRNGMLIEQNALDRCSLAIYASEWAAETALKYYQVDPQKIKVVPFGANLSGHRSLENIKDIIKAKPQDLCRLLFLGIDWQRKGGNIAIQVAQSLNSSGINTELTIVGCQPRSSQLEQPLPSFVKVVGHISKATELGKQIMVQLISESHFLIVPTRADCGLIVGCEANSFGVPCLSTNVGGLPSVIRSGINGQLFERDADIFQYRDFIAEMFTNYAKYKLLATNSFNEYQSRLNWDSSTEKVRDLLKTISNKTSNELI
jgi:glycosyltransferase involved in cell wall biosynthesis